MSVEMKKVKVDALEGAALDWAVAKAVGQEIDDTRWAELRVNVASGLQSPWRPSSNWHQCGPLIEKYRVSILYSEDEKDPCAWIDGAGVWGAATPLIAACIAIVDGKFGAEVEVPAELAEGLE